MNTRGLLFTLLIVLATFANIATADDITVGGTARTYVKYVPSQLGAKRPLLISMHGMNQDANYQRGMLQIESIADTAKFAVVFPEGLNRSWDISGTSDINFVLAIIDDMVSKHDIDVNRVYLSGFSMGGMFTYHAMNHIADRIAAFAPISGYPMGGQPFTSSRPVPIIHTHGTGDDVVAFSGVQRSLDGWIKRNGCDTKAVVTNPYRTGIATRHQWGPGDDGVEVVLLELKDKGHWISNDGFYTGEEIWNFCKRYSLDPNIPQVTINYPQSGGTFMCLGAANDLRVRYEADAFSPDSEITSVAFYCDDELVADLSEPPYVYEWAEASKGSHQLKVVATDAKGRATARAIPYSAKAIMKKLDVSSAFKENGVIPAGWVSCDSRNTKVGPVSGISASNRVLQLTGTPRDFDYAMQINNITGVERGGYVAYADPRGSASLVLAAGTYNLSYKCCNWGMLSTPTEVRCEVVDAVTGEVIAESSCTPAVSLEKDAAKAFTGADDMSVDISLEENAQVVIAYYAADVKKADAMVADIVLQKSATQGILDVQTARQPSEVTYYDLMGRRLATPSGTLMIRRTVYSDGTVVTDKLHR